MSFTRSSPISAWVIRQSGHGWVLWDQYRPPKICKKAGQSPWTSMTAYLTGPVSSFFKSSTQARNSGYKVHHPRHPHLHISALPEIGYKLIHAEYKVYSVYSFLLSWCNVGTTVIVIELNHWDLYGSKSSRTFGRSKCQWHRIPRMSHSWCRPPHPSKGQ